MTACRLFATLLLFLSLAACGQKGELFLPEEGQESSGPVEETTPDKNDPDRKQDK